jgi:hypothetical protein
MESGFLIEINFWIKYSVKWIIRKVMEIQYKSLLGLSPAAKTKQWFILRTRSNSKSIHLPLIVFLDPRRSRMTFSLPSAKNCSLIHSRVIIAASSSTGKLARVKHIQWWEITTAWCRGLSASYFQGLTEWAMRSALWAALTMSCTTNK